MGAASATAVCTGEVGVNGSGLLLGLELGHRRVVYLGGVGLSQDPEEILSALGFTVAEYTDHSPKGPADATGAAGSTAYLFVIADDSAWFPMFDVYLLSLFCSV